MAQILSSYNVAAQLQQYVCEALSASEWLQQLNIQFFPENSKDIDYQIKNALAQQGLACVVMTPSLEYQGHDGIDIAWDAKDLTLQIVEFTPVNRASNKLSVTTGLDIAVFAQNYLGGPQCAEEFGRFCPKAVTQSEEAGLLVTKATFDTTVVGQIDGPYEWDGHHVITMPYALLSDLLELSSYAHSLPGVDDLSALSTTVVVLSGEVADLSTRMTEYLPLSGGKMNSGAKIQFTAPDSINVLSAGHLRLQKPGPGKSGIISIDALSGINIINSWQTDPKNILSTITFGTQTQMSSLADIISAAAGSSGGNYVPLSGGELYDGASLWLKDEAFADTMKLRADAVRLSSFQTDATYSAYGLSMHNYEEMEELQQPEDWLKLIKFGVLDQWKSLSEILSGYCSKDYVDQMIGDLEQLLETT